MTNQEEKKNVLVVEDETPLLKVIKIKFEQGGFDVAIARKAEQAIDLLEDLGRVDVIWLDHYLLGKEDGLDLLSKIKKEDKWKDIPVYVVSNTASPEKMQSYISLGADKYYVKSDYRLDQIIGDIKESLGQ